MACWCPDFLGEALRKLRGVEEEGISLGPAYLLAPENPC